MQEYTTDTAYGELEEHALSSSQAPGRKPHLLIHRIFIGYLVSVYHCTNEINIIWAKGPSDCLTYMISHIHMKD